MEFEIKDPNSADVNVATFNVTNNAEYGWPDPEISAMLRAPGRDFRRVAMIPLSITSDTLIELPAGEVVVGSNGIPAIKDGFALTVFDWLSGEPIKETLIAVPLVNFLDMAPEGPKVKLVPGVAAHTLSLRCLLDITGIPNNSKLVNGLFSQEVYGLYIECQIPGLFLSLSTPIRLGRYQLRHSGRVDLL